MKTLWLNVLTFVCSIFPLAIYIAFNYQRYVYESTEMTLSIGVFVAILFVLIALKDRMAEFLKHNAQLKISLFLLLFVWGIGSISKEIIIFCALSALGSAIALIPGYFVRKAKIEKLQKDQATATATAMAEAFKENKITINKR